MIRLVRPALQANEQPLQARIAGRRDATLGFVREPGAEQRQAVVRIARIRRDRAVRGTDLRNLAPVEARDQEVGRIAERVVERRNVVVTHPHLDGQPAAHLPTVLKIEVELIEPSPIVRVRDGFGIVLKITEQDIGDDVSGRIAG